MRCRPWRLENILSSLTITLHTPATITISQTGLTSLLASVTSTWRNTSNMTLGWIKTSSSLATRAITTMARQLMTNITSTLTRLTRQLQCQWPHPG